MNNKATALSINIEPGSDKLHVAYFGSDDELINLLAVAMDDQTLRSIFYRAVTLDLEHNELVGRRQDIK